MLRWQIPHSRAFDLCCDWMTWPVPIRSLADDPDAVSRLLADPEFDALLDFKYIDIVHTALEYDAGIQTMTEILDAIDDSLSD